MTTEPRSSTTHKPLRRSEQRLAKRIARYNEFQKNGYNPEFAKAAHKPGSNKAR